MSKNKICAVVIAILMMCMGVAAVCAEPVPGYPADTQTPSDSVIDGAPESSYDEPTTEEVYTEAPTVEETTEFEGDKVEPDNPFDVSHNDTNANKYENVDPDNIIQEAEQIRINIDSNGDDIGFGFNKNEESKSDERSIWPIVLGGVFLFLSLGFATFAILFKAPATADATADTEEEVADAALTEPEKATPNAEAIKPRRERNVEVVDHDYFDGF